MVEDLIYERNEVGYLPQVEQIASYFANLLPVEEPTRARLQRHLIVLPDDELTYLCQTSLPVNARIKLTEGKTTGSYRKANGEEESGNLWYEETLPSDTLFAFFVTERPDPKTPGHRGNGGAKSGMNDFRKTAAHQPQIQLGGNETIGHGFCWWTLR